MSAAPEAPSPMEVANDLMAQAIRHDRGDRLLARSLRRGGETIRKLVLELAQLKGERPE